jgi:hypothetical protein
MSKVDPSKEHDELVREIEKEIESLGLLTMRRAGVFSRGFLPDIVVNVGGGCEDWVIIDVINTSSSLKRDIAGLLTIKANAEKRGYSIRGILGVCSNRIRTIENYTALIEQFPNFIMVRPPDVKVYLERWMFESAKEKLNKLGYVTSYILKRTKK